ncbi:hypothetical protein BDZ94DRAFT_1263646 [Collybia nuda]|uniref:F-box domain-containing protein n=1 Tax=Collybia nuda TaxID=64659 RepID=A0A9P5Y331_9AGAR|nr:hypothetical protein BDZ94DRAFT_1263646 [Collybia nuda]
MTTTTLNVLESPHIAHLEPHAFSTNDALSDRDQQLVREVLVETENHVQSLDKEISRLQAAIDRIQGLRSSEITRISRLRMGVAPHRRAPPEVLAKIFVHCAVMEGSKVYLPPRCNYSIWDVIQVCSRWRKIAFAEPLLWNCVSVSSCKTTEGLNNLVHDILSHRGGNGIIDYGAPPIYSCREWQGISSLLTDYPRRLRRIGLGFVDFVPSSFSTPCALFDNLQSIAISFVELRVPRNFENTTIKAFSTARNLREVLIRSEERNIKIFSTWATCISLPWAQLTHLTIDGIPTTVLVNMLEHCAQLISCRVGPQGSLSTEEPLRRSICLENIHSMFFSSYSDYSAVVAILDLLVVANMRNLAFALPDWEEWPQKSVLDLIQRSRCRIESFRTPEGALVDDEVIPLMRAMPRLTKLSAYHKEPVSDSTLNTIVTENLCPNLGILKGLQVSSLQSFSTFLRRRWNGSGGGLWHISATVPSETFNQEEEYYESLQEDFGSDWRKIIVEPYFE